MSKAKFNQNEPFDTCHGRDPLNRVYFQDGRYFDVNGDEVVEGETLPVKSTEEDAHVAKHAKGTKVK